MSYQSIVPGSSSSSSSTSPLLRDVERNYWTIEKDLWITQKARPRTYYENFSLFIFTGLFAMFMGILIILNTKGYNDSDKGSDERDVDIMVGLGFGITGIYALIGFYLIYQKLSS
jgi:cytochrome bd-type quinol oxidase subunit 1